MKLITLALCLLGVACTDTGWVHTDLTQPTPTTNPCTTRERYVETDDGEAFCVKVASGGRLGYRRVPRDEER